MSTGSDAIPTLVDEVDTQPVSRRGQILIVDDNPSNLMALEVALAPLDRPIVKASSGRECLLQLLEKEFTVVLLDVQMPDMDGFETATMIRARERTRHVPIIFLTAHDRDHDMVLRAYRLGAVDFLQKPFEPVVLLAKTSVFVSLRDRTEDLATERLQRELEAARRDYETQALRQQMEALAEIDRRKDSFLAILGHELRNPLAPIRTAIDLLRSRPETPPSARTVDILDRQTKMMTRLVEDLLDLSRISANKMELRPDRADLRDIVEAAVGTSKPAVEQRHHRLIVDLGDIPVRVVVDNVRLVQVITNLINNAARYTESGGEIIVTCGIEDERAFVRVRDDGIGIPPELMPKIFDMFVQERVRSDGSGGLGLGLALARRLVEMHHGTISATSDGRGTGSTFAIELPLDGQEDVAIARTRSDAIPPLTAQTEALRTVVVDDNADARELLAELLKSQGHEVMTADDGTRGLALIREQRPDVAIVDLGLPGIDGFALASELREQCPDLRTRLIALTGYGHSTDVQRTKAAGYHAHLVKPASMKAILSALR